MADTKLNEYISQALDLALKSAGSEDLIRFRSDKSAYDSFAERVAQDAIRQYYSEHGESTADTAAFVSDQFSRRHDGEADFVTRQRLKYIAQRYAAKITASLSRTDGLRLDSSSDVSLSETDGLSLARGNLSDVLDESAPYLRPGPDGLSQVDRTLAAMSDIKRKFELDQWKRGANIKNVMTGSEKSALNRQLDLAARQTADAGFLPPRSEKLNDRYSQYRPPEDVTVSQGRWDAGRVFFTQSKQWRDGAAWNDRNVMAMRAGAIANLLAGKPIAYDTAPGTESSAALRGPAQEGLSETKVTELVAQSAKLAGIVERIERLIERRDNPGTTPEEKEKLSAKVEKTRETLRTELKQTTDSLFTDWRREVFMDNHPGLGEKGITQIFNRRAEQLREQVGPVNSPGYAFRNRVAENAEIRADRLKFLLDPGAVTYPNADHLAGAFASETMTQDQTKTIDRLREEMTARQTRIENLQFEKTTAAPRRRAQIDREVNILRSEQIESFDARTKSIFEPSDVWRRRSAMREPPPFTAASSAPFSPSGSVPPPFPNAPGTGPGTPTQPAATQAGRPGLWNNIAQGWGSFVSRRFPNMTESLGEKWTELKGAVADMPEAAKSILPFGNKAKADEMARARAFTYSEKEINTYGAAKAAQAAGKTGEAAKLFRASETAGASAKFAKMSFGARVAGGAIEGGLSGILQGALAGGAIAGTGGAVAGGVAAGTAGAVGGAAAGAAGAAAAIPVAGLVIAGIILAAGAVTIGLEKLAEGAKKTAMELGKFNGGLNAAAATNRIMELQRNVEFSSKTSGSYSNILRSDTFKKSGWMEAAVAFSRAKNLFITTWNYGIGLVGRLLDPFMRLFNKLLDYMEKVVRLITRSDESSDRHPVMEMLDKLNRLNFQPPATNYGNRPFSQQDADWRGAF